MCFMEVSAQPTASGVRQNITLPQGYSTAHTTPPHPTLPCVSEACKTPCQVILSGRANTPRLASGTGRSFALGSLWSALPLCVPKCLLLSQTKKKRETERERDRRRREREGGKGGERGGRKENKEGRKSCSLAHCLAPVFTNCRPLCEECNLTT